MTEVTLDVRHRLLQVPGGRIHLAEQGTGPLVLLVHGFRVVVLVAAQLPALAAAVRVVAIDVRGYGRSSKPADVAAYRMLAHVADNAGVVHALGEQTAIIVGHDWGAPIAANSALLRPAAIKNFPATLPGLVSAHILDGCGHWVQQERPDEVNRLLTGWLHSLGSR